MPPLLETPRLSIRRFIPEDRPLFLEIEADERLTKYINRRSEERSNQLFDDILFGYSKNPDLGRWGVFSKASGEFVGVCLLSPSLYDAHYIELGYRLHYNFWGQGLATEIAAALVEYGFKELGIDEISAVIHPENKASERVLLKTGFLPRGKVFWYDDWLPFYHIKNEKDSLPD